MIPSTFRTCTYSLEANDFPATGSASNALPRVPEEGTVHDRDRATGKITTPYPAADPNVLDVIDPDSVAPVFANYAFELE